MNLFRLLTLSIGTMTLIYGEASACMSPNASNVGATELIETADAIYLAQLRGAMQTDTSLDSIAPLTVTSSLEQIIQDARRESAKAVIYNFDVLEAIKGADRPSVQLIQPISQLPGNASDFDEHRNDAFWNDPSFGRAQIASDCSVVTSFEFGKSYLLIISDNPTVKSFERIQSSDDALLNYVTSIYKTE